MPAQRSPIPEDINGYSGNLSVFPNPNLQQVTVVLNSSTPVTATSSQIVLVLSGYFNDYPSAWQGSGRLLLGRKFVGVIKSTPEGEAFEGYKFPETDTPESTKVFSHPSLRDVFGIARFGEGSPLTEIQIAELASSGNFTRAKMDPLTKAISSLQAPRIDAQSAGGGAMPAFGGGCSSGGPGSTSCGSGGCTVGCANNLYACCSGGSCTCKPIPVNPN